VVCSTYWLMKVVPTWKKFEKRCCTAFVGFMTTGKAILTSVNYIKMTHVPTSFSVSVCSCHSSTAPCLTEASQHFVITVMALAVIMSIGTSGYHYFMVHKYLVTFTSISHRWSFSEYRGSGTRIINSWCGKTTFPATHTLYNFRRFTRVYFGTRRNQQEL